MTRPLVLIGFMGAGKTTAARELAEQIGTRPLDTDALVEQRLGKAVADVFAQDGEPAFRAAEEEVVLEALARSDGVPIALGGGAVMSSRVQAALESHRVVFLDGTEEHLRARVLGSDRPLARDREEFSALLAQRKPVYESLADVFVSASDAPRLSRVLADIAALDEAPAGTRLVVAYVKAEPAYPVYVGEELLQAGFYPVEGRRFAVTDGNVARWYLGSLEPLLGSASIMPGEASKTVAHAEVVWSEMVRHGVTRADHVVALGGGVVGDLAGFCAATYQRGIGVVQVPTSLVAQVDAAYGGKTGVDLSEAKNYVGAYHQPAAVITDAATLRTLPAPELAAGYVEVLKTALIAGGELWERVRSGRSDGTDAATILACARTKLGVVAEDERDAGGRQVLNLGHTVGHAIESATGYVQYRHGEAVGLGLLAALRLSGQEALREEVAGLLRARGLPTTLQDVAPEDVVRAVARDKKRLGERPVPFVLLDAPGAPRTGCAVDDAELRAVVGELAA